MGLFLLRASTRRHALRRITLAMAVPPVDVHDVCTAKHALLEFRVDRPRWFACDLCAQIAAEGATMFGCFEVMRSCNYCLCEACYGTDDSSARKLKAAVAAFEPIFREMAWTVAVVERENLAQQTSDAICFRAMCQSHRA